jgi:hypothetical protein
MPLFLRNMAGYVLPIFKSFHSPGNHSSFKVDIKNGITIIIGIT